MSDQLQRVFTTAFKEEVVLRLLAGETVAALSGALGIRRKSLYEWRNAYRELGVGGLNRKRGRKPGGKRRAGLRRADVQRLDKPSAEGAPALPGQATPGDELAQAKARIAELERVIGRQQMDLDFFQAALRLTDAEATRAPAAPASARSSKP